VLVLSDSRDEARVATAIAAGWIPMSTSLETLLHAICTVAVGHPMMSEMERHSWLARHRCYHAEKRQLAQPLGRLSRREREVVALMAQGHRAAAVARHLVVSMPTVRAQIQAILTKLEVSSQPEAVALASEPEFLAIPARGWHSDAEERITQSVPVATCPALTIYGLNVIAAMVPGGVLIVRLSNQAFFALFCIGARTVSMVALPGLAEAVADGDCDGFSEAWRAGHYHVMLACRSCCASCGSGAAPGTHPLSRGRGRHDTYSMLTMHERNIACDPFGFESAPAAIEEVSDVTALRHQIPALWGRR
jgi:Response regulator containing a CheY-like receiver domain and an HTH DNA-binding domain